KVLFDIGDAYGEGFIDRLYGEISSVTAPYASLPYFSPATRNNPIVGTGVILRELFIETLL
ncbi:MAG: hypothetical protein IJU57_06025, partial [Clostridia bacterium]|nr:hypothetical protein [Clostridia bacterium]